MGSQDTQAFAGLTSDFQGQGVVLLGTSQASSFWGSQDFILQAHHDKILDRTLPQLKRHLVSRSIPQMAWPACTFIFLVLAQPGLIWGPLVEGAPEQSPQVGRTGAIQASPEYSFLCQDKEYMYTEIYTKLCFQRCFINQVIVPREISSPRSIPRHAQSPGDGASGVLRLSHLPLGSCREGWVRIGGGKECAHPAVSYRIL